MSVQEDEPDILYRGVVLPYMAQEWSIGDRATGNSVKNLAIFIADSLRNDALPDDVAERGINMRAVAPSTYTGSSIPSLLSGYYPAEHKVWNFEQQLPREPLLLREAEHTGLCAETIWTHIKPERKPPIRMLKTASGEPLPSIQEPFVYIEHDKGGHTPYGYSFDVCESAPLYYADHVDVADDVRRDYRRGVDRSAERFIEFLDRLKDRSLLDQTLVIFTSDHGELLGERNYGGVYGHGRPMTPELIDIPIVFCGVGLPDDTITEFRVSGVDIVPTALAAQGRPVPNRLPGVDLWTTPLQEIGTRRPLRSDIWQRVSIRGRSVTTYAATSAWDHSGGGGIVFQRGSTPTRIAHAHYHHYQSAPHASLMRSEWNPGKYSAFVRTYTCSRHQYGSSSTSFPVDELPTKFEDRPQNSQKVDEYTRDQLAKLGYT